VIVKYVSKIKGGILYMGIVKSKNEEKKTGNSVGKKVLGVVLVTTLLGSGTYLVMRKSRGTEVVNPPKNGYVLPVDPPQQEEPPVVIVDPEESEIPVEEEPISEPPIQEPVNMEPINEPPIQEPVNVEPIPPVNEPPIQEPVNMEPINEPPVQEPVNVEPIPPINEPPIQEPVNMEPINEPPVQWDLFDPTNESELTAVVENIIAEMKKFPVFVQIDSPTVCDMVYMLNGLKVENEERVYQALNDLKHIIHANLGNAGIRDVILGEKPLNKHYQIPYGIASSLVNDYILKYEKTIQPIKEAARNRERKALIEKLVTHVDEYYRKIFGEEDFVKGVKFEDLPLTAKFIILEEYSIMNGLVNLAEYENVLAEYNIKPQYDATTRADKITPLKININAEMRQRALKWIAQLTEEELISIKNWVVIFNNEKEVISPRMKKVTSKRV
jgi:hypothetical protein